MIRLVGGGGGGGVLLLKPKKYQNTNEPETLGNEVRSVAKPLGYTAPLKQHNQYYMSELFGLEPQ